MNKVNELIAELVNSIKHDDVFDAEFNRRNPTVKLHESTLGTDEIIATVRTMLSGYTTMGKQVKQFEHRFAQEMHADYGIMVNSGSSANLLAIAALTNPVTPNRLQPGDEVIVPALCWSTTIWPLVQHQLIPVLVDCDLETLNIDVEKLENAITPKTRAIMCVHVYGNPCNMDAIRSIAQQYNLLIIEDCCEAMGATYQNQSVGNFGSIGTFSFFFSHHITTMEGGIVVCNQFDLTETMRILRAHGWSREAEEHQKFVNRYPDIDPRFIFVNQGYNLRPTEVNAAIGLCQIEKLRQFILNRQYAANYLQKHLAEFQDFFQWQVTTPNSTHAWLGFPLIVKPNKAFTKECFINFLQQHHIETRPIIAGNIAKHPAMQLYQHRIGSDLSMANQVMQQGCALPCHQGITQDVCAYIVDVIRQFIQEKCQSMRSFA